MTQDKELLLKDLCARLPYGVKAMEHEDEPPFTIVGYECLYFCDDNGWEYKVDEIKPYLFPLSSITKEIMDEIYATTGVYDISIDSSVHIEVGTTFIDLTKIFDILHKHHIDYRGLIPMGLALDATGLNIY